MSDFSSLDKEYEYSKTVSSDHLKLFGQYFTNPNVSRFMCRWACADAKKMLDPAVGNSVFFKHTKELNEGCNLVGYEIDNQVLDYFGNPTNAKIKNMDYLLNDWNDQFDAIVCNPPYNRFQSIANRSKILDIIFLHTGIRYSSYTNLCILFLIKSIHQLSNAGRLAYIIPSEFLNSKYGTAVKQLILEQKLLHSIINFRNDQEMFFNATTTSCILLLNHEPKDTITFYNLEKISDLKLIEEGKSLPGCTYVKYDDISAKEKWRAHINQEKENEFFNLTDVSKYCSVSRGIATGANKFFCLNLSEIESNNIDKKFISKCVCRSADVKSPIFTSDDFNLLSSSNKTVYLLDVKEAVEGGLASYIGKGENTGINKKYLPANRNPWYSMEQRGIAPIWVTSACRNKIKFVRNIAGVKSLTTFHSIFIREDFRDYVDLIFCYFLTPAAQTIIRKNRKELGNNLEKFQPNDFNTAKMLDISLICDEDKKIILEVYKNLHGPDMTESINKLNEIFLKYLTNQKFES